MPGYSVKANSRKELENSSTEVNFTIEIIEFCVSFVDNSLLKPEALLDMFSMKFFSLNIKGIKKS